MIIWNVFTPLPEEEGKNYTEIVVIFFARSMQRIRTKNRLLNEEIFWEDTGMTV